MSTLYLPNGGRIVIHNGWKSTTDASGHVSIRKHDDTYLGCIHTNGSIHLTNECNHTFYPAGTTLDNAFEVIKRDVQKLSYWQLKVLKTLLSSYNARSYTWKK